MFHLRYYQHDAREAIRAAHDRHHSTACIMATACGKTETFLSLAVEDRGRTLILVHRDYLIDSPVQRLARIGFTDIAIEKAEQRAERGGKRAQIVFASVQSIGPEKQRSRLESFNPRDFAHLVIDEGHRALAGSYRRVQEYFEAGNPRLKKTIYTATPKRKDGLALGNICESVAYEMTPAQAAEEGWIVPPRFFVRDVPELDFSTVEMRGSDMDAEQMAELTIAEEPLHKVCASLNEFAGPTIVFCPKVKVAESYAAVLNGRYRSGKAIPVHQHTSDEDVERAIKGLADGSVDWVLCVDRITEGFDVPAVARVAWVCPTASLVRWTQGCGRGFRPHHTIAHQLRGNKEDAALRRQLIASSPKPFCEILTYFPSNCQHQICSAVDLLGGSSLPGDVKTFAAQIQSATARQGGGSDTEEDIKTARAFCDLRAVLEERRKHLKARATVVDREYDGMGGKSQKLRNPVASHVATGGVEAILAAGYSWGSLEGHEPSDKQVNWFLWKGVARDVAVTLHKWRAVVVRDLFELGHDLQRALCYEKRQALKVRDEMKAKREKQSQGSTEGVPV